MQKHVKLFTRDNGLLVFELWYESEVKHLRKWLDWTPSSYLLHAIEGVTEVYYDPSELEEFNERIASKLHDENFLPSLLAWYQEALVPLQEAWKKNKPFKTLAELVELFDRGALAWSGLAITYLIPNLPGGKADPAQIEAALNARKDTENFFEDTDHIFLTTLEVLFPDLGALSRYIRIEELRSGKLPSQAELAEREKGFIFYRGDLHTGIALETFTREHDIQLEKVVVPQSGEITGQVAMRGSAKGKARVILKKKDIATLEEGEILVATMTTPDYLPAMKRAAAFVTDEGGITCHAAIVARELKKPCIVGTKYATHIMHDGDLVEVDANTGIVKVLKLASDSDT